MMTSEDIRDRADFKHLVALRLRVAFALSAFMAGSFAVYLYLLSDGRDIAVITLSQDGLFNIGLLVAVCIVVLGGLVSGVYVLWANRVVDLKRQRLIDALNHE